ncbi:hypothetical protein AOXY_G22247 [Acipenser oxyrinchus oxyrinchus]|uniref:Uncharacterized protein n=1 Tax=Acipenser oxyrinchus oxyrinchus TaxID=40147 RepID=A0AAD8CZG1_ACIOX|nr:hypothetical protein AOXY_G22247 [Acipenser oxyrinchus oxyrinchus]
MCRNRKGVWNCSCRLIRVPCNLATSKACHYRRGTAQLQTICSNVSTSLPLEKGFVLPGMALQYILILAGLAFQFLCQTPTILGASLFRGDCCMDELDVNGTCPVNTPCRPGCYRHQFENGTTCLQCKSLILAYNATECSNLNSNETYLWTNTSTAGPPQPTIGGPAVAASLLLGTLFISLFLILSVASFFYLKRSSKLPDVFYRRNKASILQPSETAVMIPTPTSSVRKPRYVRRERPSVISTSATISSAATTRVSNV